MDFGKKLLEKYGWQEGKGLGKHETGINTAIRPKLKFDRNGIGHDPSKEFTNNWWENLYNNTSNNIDVIRKDDGVYMNIRNQVGAGCSNYLKDRKSESRLQYGSFIQRQTLTESGIVDNDNNNGDVQSDHHKHTPVLTDEQLFAACSGRTAHKGARHGINSSGKLSRLEKQEKLLMKRLNKISLSDENDSKTSIEKKLKKIKDHKTKKSDDGSNFTSFGSQGEKNFTDALNNIKKRKKERKRVSFNETVTEYQTVEVDLKAPSNTMNKEIPVQKEVDPLLSTPITTVRKIKIKEDNIIPNNDHLLNLDVDEGIDCSEFEVEVRPNIKIGNSSKSKFASLRKQEEMSTEDIKNFGCSSLAYFDRSHRKYKRNFEKREDMETKKCHYDSPTLSKKMRKKHKLKRHLEANIDNVTNSFNVACKVSDVDIN